MYRINSYLYLIILIITSTNLYAQKDNVLNYRSIEGSSNDKKLIIAIVNEDIFNNPEQLISTEELISKKTSLLLFNEINTSVLTIYSRLNIRINNFDKKFRKSHLHLIIMGGQNTLEKYEDLDLNYFNSYTFISQDSTIANTPFRTIEDKSWNSKKYLYRIKDKYKWPVDMDNMKPVKKQIVEHDEGKFTIGYKFGIHNGTDQDKRIFDQFVTHGISADYKLSNQLLLTGDFNFSLNRDDPQNAAQKQIFNQIDIFGALSGTNTKQTINLNLTLKGQIHFSGKLGLKYLFNSRTPFNPYVQTNLSLPVSKNLTGSLDTTLVIDIADAFSGGLNAGVNRDDLDPESAGLTINSATNINWGFGGGIQIKLSGHLRFDLGFDYSHSILSLEDKPTFNNNNFNVSFGLNIRFRDQKKYYFEHFY